MLLTETSGTDTHIDPIEKLKKQSAKNEGLSSFTGADVQVYIFYPGLYTKDQLEKHIHNREKSSIFRKLGTLRDFHWGFTRTKSVVTHLGRAVGKGFTRGTRIITGVMIFMQIDRTAFSPLYDRDKFNEFDTSSKDDFSPYRYIDSPDSLPPFNLLLVYVNEYGTASYRMVHHVEIVQGQGSDSIDNSTPLESYSFVALSITPLLPLTAMLHKPIDNPNITEIKYSKVILSKEVNKYDVGDVGINQLEPDKQVFKLHVGNLFDDFPLDKRNIRNKFELGNAIINKELLYDTSIEPSNIGAITVTNFSTLIPGTAVLTNPADQSLIINPTTGTTTPPSIDIFPIPSIENDDVEQPVT